MVGEEILEIQEFGEGNTNNSSPNSPKKQCSQLLHWFFTYNNYKEEDIETLETFFKYFCTKYCFQRERGSEGTPHLQGVISLKKKMRWSEFGLMKEIHWEKVQNLTYAYKYCSKIDSREINTLPYVLNYVYETPLRIISSLQLWMNDIINIINQDADPRKIHWRWESNGGIGKSSFAKYMCYHYNCMYIDEGKKSDIINLIYKMPVINERTIIVIDIPRDNGNNVSYKAIEQIKNGMIYNTKFETGMRIFNPPHIIIFSNFPPCENKLSADRWDIKELVNPNADI